jgi:FeS assembly protein IscX
MPEDTYHWLDVERIAEELADQYDEEDPLAVAFPRLREMVEQLEGFRAQTGHPVNEKILESIQQAWYDEVREQATGPTDEPD